MGYYSDKRNEFFDIFGYYPKKDILEKYLANQIEFFVCEIKKFISNNKTDNYINKLKFIFVNRFKFQPNAYDLFSFRKAGKQKYFLPSKIYLFFLLLFRKNCVDFCGLVDNDSIDICSNYGYTFYDLLLEILMKKNHVECLDINYASFLLSLFLEKEKLLKFINSISDVEEIDLPINSVEEYIDNTMILVDKIYNNEDYIFDFEFLKENRKVPIVNLKKLYFVYLFKNKEKFRIELVDSINSGIYTPKMLYWLFDSSKDLTMDVNIFSYLVNHINIENIFLPRSPEINYIDFSNDLFTNKKINIHVPQNYIEYDISDKYNVILESYRHFYHNFIHNRSYGCRNGMMCKHQFFRDAYSKFYSKFQFKPTCNQFLFFLEDEDRFDLLFDDVKKFLKTGNVGLNAENIIYFFDNTVAQEFNWSNRNVWGEYFCGWDEDCFSELIGRICEDTLYWPPYKSWEKPIGKVKISSFNNLKRIIFSKEYNYFPYNYFTELKLNKEIEVVIEDPYNNEMKIKSLVGTKYYEEFVEEFLKTNDLYSLKFLVAPDCLKDALKKTPSMTVYVIYECNDCGNNGINKIWWREIYEAYHWDHDLKYWKYIEERDCGSD